MASRYLGVSTFQDDAGDRSISGVAKAFDSDAIHSLAMQEEAQELLDELSGPVRLRFVEPPPGRPTLLAGQLALLPVGSTNWYGIFVTLDLDVGPLTRSPILTVATLSGFGPRVRILEKLRSTHATAPSPYNSTVSAVLFEVDGPWPFEDAKPRIAETPGLDDNRKAQILHIDLALEILRIWQAEREDDGHFQAVTPPAVWLLQALRTELLSGDSEGHQDSLVQQLLGWCQGLKRASDHVSVPLAFYNSVRLILFGFGVDVPG